jgi:hypothetical protein
MRAIVFVLAIVLLSAGLNAQQIEWSNQQRIKSKANYTHIIGQNGAGIYTIKSRNNDFSRDLYIEKFKLNLSHEDEKPFWQPGTSSLEKIIVNESGLQSFASVKSGSNIEIVTWTIDNSLNVLGQPTMLLQEQSSSMEDRAGLSVIHNQDRSAMAIIYFTKHNDKNTTVLNLAMFGKQNQFIYKKQFPIRYSIAEFSIRDVVLDANKNVFMLFDFPRTKDGRRKREERNFLVYAYLDDEKEMLEYEPIADSLIITDAQLAYNPVKGTMCVAGFYRNLDATTLAGTFQYAIDIETRKVAHKSVEVFSSQFVARMNAISLSTNGLNDLYVRRVVPRSDGGCMIAGERFYETRQSYTYYVNGFPQVSYRVVYNYDEIVLINKNNQGVTQQAEVIKKKQSSMNDGGYFSSFVMVNTNDRIAFIYNADVSAEGDIMITSVSPAGEVDTRILVKSLSFYVSLMPSESRQISYNTILASTLKDKKYALMRIVF